MTSKLLIKTVEDTSAETPLVAGKHLLAMDGFRTFSIADEIITFLFDQENSQVQLTSAVVGDSDKANEIIYNALSNSSNSIIELDLSSAGYEINSISFTAIPAPEEGGGGDIPLIHTP